MRRLICGLLIFSTALAISSCKPNEGDVKETSLETSATETTIAPTATPSPEPTSTPTPTPTPLPTPTPTPVPEYIPAQYDTVWYGDFVDPRSVTAVIIDNPYEITALVNKYYALPEDFKPDDLVPAPHSYNQELRTECNDAWVNMYNDCVEQTGQGLLLVSGWRDWTTSTFLFDRSVNLRGVAFACSKNAWPGRSEHQLGLAIDITAAWDDNISDDFGSTTVGQWVDAHCFEYGFIRRYQPQYVTETGYGIEAWHYRYVGVDVATILYENDMSLEAYLGKAQIMPGDEE